MLTCTNDELWIVSQTQTHFNRFWYRSDSKNSWVSPLDASSIIRPNASRACGRTSLDSNLKLYRLASNKFPILLLNRFLLRLNCSLAEFSISSYMILSGTSRTSCLYLSKMSLFLICFVNMWLLDYLRFIYLIIVG